MRIDRTNLLKRFIKADTVSEPHNETTVSGISIEERPDWINIEQGKYGDITVTKNQAKDLIEILKRMTE